MEYEFIILGAGFSGLCLGAKLKQKGYHNFIILEKNQVLEVLGFVINIQELNVMLNLICILFPFFRIRNGSKFIQKGLKFIITCKVFVCTLTCTDI